MQTHQHTKASSTHSPQPSGALCLIDVDEVRHHAALKQTALRLHSDLKQQTDRVDKTFLYIHLQHIT